MNMKHITSVDEETRGVVGMRVQFASGHIATLKEACSCEHGHPLHWRGRFEDNALAIVYDTNIREDGFTVLYDPRLESEDSSVVIDGYFS